MARFRQRAPVHLWDFWESAVFIVTGANAAVAETAQFDGRDNPVFNFFREVYLQLLDANECKLMIKTLGRGMGIRFEDTACESIHVLRARKLIMVTNDAHCVTLSVWAQQKNSSRNTACCFRT